MFLLERGSAQGSAAGLCELKELGRIEHDCHIRETLGRRGPDGRKEAKRRETDTHDVVKKGEGQVLLDGPEGPPSDSDRLRDKPPVVPMRATWAASMATSAPAAPMAIPTSAWAKAGASLIPSPTTATILPSRWSRRTSSIFSSGRSSALYSTPSFAAKAEATLGLSPVRRRRCLIPTARRSLTSNVFLARSISPWWFRCILTPGGGLDRL